MTEPPSSGPFLQPGNAYHASSTQVDSDTATDYTLQQDASGWAPSAAPALAESSDAVNAYYTNGSPGSFPDDDQQPASSSSHFSQSSSSGNNNINGTNGEPYYYSGGSQRSTLDGDDGGVPGSNIHFVYANERRFQDFHALFRSVPEDERLIEASWFTCATDDLISQHSISTTTFSYPTLPSIAAPQSRTSSGAYGFVFVVPRDTKNMTRPSSINSTKSNFKHAQLAHSRRLCLHNYEYMADYGCALQKEILVQGRLYISENHVCFNANIFGWVTNLVIAFSEITAIEKRLTAFVIPNAISIVTTTNTKGHFFASFLSRDSAYDLLMAAWRKSFPCAANAPTNGNNAYFRQNRSNLTLENGNGSGGGSGTGAEDNDDGEDANSFISARGPSADSRRNRHRRTFSNNSQNWTADEAEYDDIDDPERLQSGGANLRRRNSKRAVVRKILKDSAPSTSSKRTGRVRSVSELPPPPSHFETGRRESVGSARPSLDNSSNLDAPTPGRPRAGTEALMPPNTHPGAKKHPSKSASVTQKPAVREATTCACSKDGKHYSGTYMNETYPGTVEAMWKLLFDSDFNKSFLTNDVMKGADVQEEAWKPSPDNTQTKVTRYTKWLGMPIGPKTTKATLTDVCEHKDFNDYVTCVTTTSTPDVPSGSCFATKNRTCISWAGPNLVRVVVTGAVEFSKSTWIKGTIEKGAADGMGTHYRELAQAIRKHIASHPAEFAGAAGDGSSADTGVAASTTATNAGSDANKASNGRASPGSPRPTGTAKKANGVRPVSPVQNGDVAKVANGTVSKTSTTTTSTNSGSSSALQMLTDLRKTVIEGLSEMLNSLSSTPSTTTTSSAASEGGGLMNPLLLLVLIMVMAMNIYIWWQISSVTSQMERIQSEILEYHWKTSHHRGGGFMYQPPPPSRSQSKQPRNPVSFSGAFAPSYPGEDWNAASSSSAPPSFNDPIPNDSYDNDKYNAHDYWEEEEEAMWAWLTEREAQIRKSQERRAAAAASKGQSYPPPSSSSPSSSSSFNNNNNNKESSLQTRILELQQQLEALESRARMLENQEDQVSSEIESLP
ncbi:hypothetical protein BGW42_002173 [Actinomortierella wolfii]|nr:hypothetical protein BGW42_002173 [Actinomortierella wolfii]